MTDEELKALVAENSRASCGRGRLLVFLELESDCGELTMYMTAIYT